MKDTPLKHLRTLRMQCTMKLRADSERHLEAVASEVRSMGREVAQQRLRSFGDRPSDGCCGQERPPVTEGLMKARHMAVSSTVMYMSQ